MKTLFLLGNVSTSARLLHADETNEHAIAELEEALRTLEENAIFEENAELTEFVEHTLQYYYSEYTQSNDNAWLETLDFEATNYADNL